MPDAATLNRSVTRGDYENNSPRSGGVFHLMLPGGTVYPDLPAYWSQSRDFVLASSVDREAMWASAIAIAVTKMSSLAWDVSGDVGLRVRRAQELLQSADHNQSWTAMRRDPYHLPCRL